MQRIAFWALSLPFAAACAIGDDLPPARPRPDSQHAPAPAPRPVRPPAELKQLDFLLGTWDVTERYHDGSTGKGTMIVQKRIGETALVLVYRAKGPRGVFDGHGVIRYDPDGGVFRFWWFDSLHPGAAFATSGRLDGDTLVLIGPIPPSSQGRVIYRKLEDGKLEFSIAKNDGDGWKSTVEAMYSRQ